jgi:hypothetical protein
MPVNGLYAQDRLNVSGIIYDEEGMLEDAEILIERDSIMVSKHESDKKGRFSFELDFENKYIVTFSSDGYAPKKILVDTDLPEGKDPELFQLVSMKLELIKQYGQSPESDILGEVKFSRVTKEFAYISKYDNNPFLNVQVVGLDYYLSEDKQNILSEEEIALLNLNLDIKEREIEISKQDYYTDIELTRKKFLGSHIDSFTFDEIPLEDGKLVEDTVINRYSQRGIEITEVIINVGDIMKVFHRAKHSWGPVYYFRSFRPITKAHFYIETLLDKKQIHREYHSFKN